MLGGGNMPKNSFKPGDCVRLINELRCYYKDAIRHGTRPPWWYWLMSGGGNLPKNSFKPGDCVRLIKDTRMMRVVEVTDTTVVCSNGVGELRCYYKDAIRHGTRPPWWYWLKPRRYWSGPDPDAPWWSWPGSYRWWNWWTWSAFCGVALLLALLGIIH